MIQKLKEEVARTREEAEKLKAQKEAEGAGKGKGSSLKCDKGGTECESLDGSHLGLRVNGRSSWPSAALRIQSVRKSAPGSTAPSVCPHLPHRYVPQGVLSGSLSVLWHAPQRNSFSAFSCSLSCKDGMFVWKCGLVGGFE